MRIRFLWIADPRELNYFSNLKILFGILAGEEGVKSLAKVGSTFSLDVSVFLSNFRFLSIWSNLALVGEYQIRNANMTSFSQKGAIWALFSPLRLLCASTTTPNSSSKILICTWARTKLQPRPICSTLPISYTIVSIWIGRVWEHALTGTPNLTAFYFFSCYRLRLTFPLSSWFPLDQTTVTAFGKGVSYNFFVVLAVLLLVKPFTGVPLFASLILPCVFWQFHVVPATHFFASFSHLKIGLPAYLIRSFVTFRPILGPSSIFLFSLWSPFVTVQIRSVIIWPLPEFRVVKRAVRSVEHSILVALRKRNRFRGHPDWMLT